MKKKEKVARWSRHSLSIGEGSLDGITWFVQFLDITYIWNEKCWTCDRKMLVMTSVQQFSVAVAGKIPIPANEKCRTQ